MRKRVLINLAVSGLVVAVAGCGSSSSSTTKSTTSAPAPAATTPSTAPSTSGATSSVSIQADPSGQLAFAQKTASAKAGKVTITFQNASSVPHNLTVATASGTEVGATPTITGGSKTLSTTLKAGSYTYYCTVPGHRQAGMQGTLTVS